MCQPGGEGGRKLRLWLLVSPMPAPPYLISLTRGMGCMTTIFFLARVMMWGVRMNWPKHCGTDVPLMCGAEGADQPQPSVLPPFLPQWCSPPRSSMDPALTASYSWVDPNRSFWMRVM